jgi:hypothetical protein
MQTAAELGFPERQPQTLVEELDFLRRDRLTTTLAVTGEGGKTGRIVLLFGVPFFAETQLKTGDAALEEMQAWNGATWTVQAQKRLPEATNVSGAQEAIRAAARSALQAPQSISEVEDLDSRQVSQVEPVILRPSLLKQAYLLALAIPCVATLALLPLAIAATQVTWPVFFGMFSPAWAGIGLYILLLVWRWRLVLDSNGFTVWGAFTRKHVAWADVTSFSEDWRGQTWNRVVSFEYRPEVWARRLPTNPLSFLGLMGQVEGSYIPLFGLSVDAQIQLLESWRRRYGLPDS